jgi:hypothetical protein
VELFIIERRFESVRAAQAALSSASQQEDQDIAWGNTNLFPKSYHFALEVAHRTHRRVKFIKWFVLLFSCLCVCLRSHRGYELEGMDVTELYRRDILRFLKTGRFSAIPLSPRSFSPLISLSTKVCPSLDLAPLLQHRQRTVRALAESGRCYGGALVLICLRCPPPARSRLRPLERWFPYQEIIMMSSVTYSVKKPNNIQLYIFEV